MLSANRYEEVVKNCRALIQQKSYSGQEGNVVNAIKIMMQHYQFDDIHVDKYGNIVGGIVGNQPGKTLVLDGHIDTVPVNEEKWTRPLRWRYRKWQNVWPWHNGHERRGSGDDLSRWFFAQDNQRNFAGKIYVACIVHEECFEGIAARLVSERYKPDYVIIGKLPN
jgi:acetylornithine deacetylase/succinyl-diaminopimelate desuccinylase-like protein